MEVRSALQRQVVVAVGEMVGRCQLSRFGGWLRLFQCVCVCIMNLGFTDLGLQNVSFICFYIFIFFNLIKRTKHSLSSGFWCSDRTHAQKHPGIENQYPNPLF